MPETLTSTLALLSRPYASRSGDLEVTRVCMTIFQRRYFTHCLECTFCHDSCCQFGCDVDLDNVEQLFGDHATGLEDYTGTTRDQWLHDEIHSDAELRSGGFRRTRVVDGTCVFKNRRGRGCGIHAYCFENGLDYHELKPVICWLFPICVDGAVLRAASEVEDNSLVCVDQGLTLYRSQRQELAHIFGNDLVAELDELEGRKV